MSGKYHHRVIIITTIIYTYLSLITTYHKPMHWDVLQQIGLNKNEAKIYEALIDLGDASVSEIASAGKVNRRNVYDALKNLQAKNLVSRVLGRQQQLYRAANPKKLMHILQQQRKTAAELLPRLEKVYRTHVPDEQAFVSRGIEGVRNFWNYVLSQNDPVYFIGGKGAWHDPRLEEDRKHFFSEARKKNITISGIFDHAMRQKGEDIWSQYIPQNIRFFQPKYATNASIDICANRVILFTLVGTKDIANVSIYNIISQPLADSYRSWFSYLWNNARPL